MATVKDVLEIARRRIEAGWMQFSLGAFHTRTGRVCLIGGVFAGLHELGLMGKDGTILSPEGEKLKERATFLLRDCVPTKRHDPVSFNDTPERRKSEVVKVVECAIEKASGDYIYPVAVQ